MKLIVVCSAFIIAACDSDSSDPLPPPDVPTGKVQVLHGSPDAPPVNLLVNGNQIAGGVEFGQATPELSVAAGSQSVQVDAILPGGTTATVFGPADVDIPADTVTTISAVGPVAIPLDVSVAGKADATPAAGSARIFVLHATSGPMGSLPVDVYVDAFTDPETPVGTSAPFQFDFKETLGPVELAAGDYQIRVTLRDSLVPVYDSGQVTLSDGDDLTLAAVPNVSGGPAAVTLLALGTNGAGALLDVNTPAGLRVGHLSSDTGTVDVLADGAELLPNVNFPDITGVLSLPPATYSVAVAPDGMPTMPALGPVDLTLDAGTLTTAFAVGLSGDMTLDLELITGNDPRPVALYAKVFIYHASPAAGPVDIYLLDPALMGDISNASPAFSDVPFRGSTGGYVALDEGDYDVVVALAGTQTVAIVKSISIENGGVYTAVARDPMMGGEFDIEVLVDTFDD